MFRTPVQFVRCERGLSLLLAAAEEGDALCERQTVGESQVNAEAQRRCLCNRVISTGAREQGRGETDGRAGGRRGPAQRN